MAIKVRDLIAGLEALATPDAEVAFASHEAGLFAVHGGIARTHGSLEVVFLSGVSLSDEGGF